MRRDDVTIFEGPDGGGKSTAISRLRPDGRVTHHGPYPGETDLARLYLASLVPGQPVTLDRSWLSEPIYGAVYRGGANRVSDTQRRVLERATLARRGVVVLCLPRRETALANWRRKHAAGAEYLPDEALVNQVYDLYRDLLLAPKLDQDRFTALPVVTYDYERETIGDLRSELGEIRRIAYRPGTRVLLVGDRANAPLRVKTTVPFAGFDGAGCSGWFTDQLESIGLGEDRLAWANATAPDGTPTDAGFVAALQPVAIFALGANASRWCRENHLEYRATSHPQFWKRFHHREPYPLLEELKSYVERP